MDPVFQAIRGVIPLKVLPRFALDTRHVFGNGLYCCLSYCPLLACQPFPETRSPAQQRSFDINMICELTPTKLRVARAQSESAILLPR